MGVSRSKINKPIFGETIYDRMKLNFVTKWGSRFSTVLYVRYYMKSDLGFEEEIFEITTVYSLHWNVVEVYLSLSELSRLCCVRVP